MRHDPTIEVGDARDAQDGRARRPGDAAVGT